MTDRDPVCGMDVDRDRAAGVSTYGGRTFRFCSPACLKQFEQAPGRYAGEPGGEAAFEEHDPPHVKAGGVPLPKFGSAGAGGLEYEPGPERHTRNSDRKSRKP